MERLPTNIRVNGKQETADVGQTVSALLAAKKVTCASVVVELNARIVPKDGYDTAVLKNGDAVEILHFVGGG